MKKILFLAVGLLSLVTFTTTYAEESPSKNSNGGVQLRQQFRTEVDDARDEYKGEIRSLKDQIKINNESITSSRNNFKTNFDGARQYLIKPLTADQKKAVNNIIKVKDDAMKALQKTTKGLIKSGTVDRSGYITQATNIITTLRTSLLPYIATDKLAAFDAFIQAKINAMISNITVKQKNLDIRIDILDKKAAFKERLNQKRSELKNLIIQIKSGK